MAEHPTPGWQSGTHTNGWESFCASVDELIRRKPHTYEPARPRSSLIVRECIDRGVCVVPIYQIVQADVSLAQLDRWLPLQTVGIPTDAYDQAAKPIDVYKLGKSYYVCDGERRVAQAFARSQLFLRASVSELVADIALDQAQTIALLLEYERAQFFAAHRFAPTSPLFSASANVLGSFQKLADHLDSWRTISPCDDDTNELAWQEQLFVPLLHMTRRSKRLSFLAEYGEIDIIVWALDRHGPMCNGQPINERLMLARRTLIALWLALHSSAVERE
ncbi:MAG: hypothetical protein H7Z42_06590 [Roseiflexaceae bacterium]|nr:hypothetical protein [Roseiflexaceae bacterium]